MKELIEDESSKSFLRVPAPGEIVKGKVIGKEKSALFLELSNFGTGNVSGEEFFQAKDVLRDVEIGDEISVKILKVDTDDGLVDLSIIQAKEEVAWLELKERKTSNTAITVRISKANKGGLMSKIQGISAFLPVSQLSPEHYPRVESGDRAEILRKLQRFIGQEFKVKIIAIDPKQRSIILSEKAATLENKIETLKKYQVGDVVKGEIAAITDFGAFIKFPLAKGGKSLAAETLEGLIHISELDWQLIHDPAEVVQVGEKVETQIIDISNGKISLSLKALKEDPWKELPHQKGDEIEGEVMKFNPFGVFVKVGPKIQALCHISEFKNEQEMKDKLQIGNKYKFRISLIKPEEHKMILKLIEVSVKNSDENQTL